MYSKLKEPYHGLIQYRSDNSIPIYSGDVYAFSKEDGKDGFYLDCVKDKAKHHRYWNCMSGDKVLYPGITYRYYYNEQYLKNAVAIDQKISDLFRKQNVKFMLSHENIKAWKEQEQGFSIMLMDSAKDELSKLTRENIGKIMEVSVGTSVVASPVIREPIGGGQLIFAVDDEMKEKLLILLPRNRELK